MIFLQHSAVSLLVDSSRYLSYFQPLFIFLYDTYLKEGVRVNLCSIVANLFNSQNAVSLRQFTRNTIHSNTRGSDNLC